MRNHRESPEEYVRSALKETAQAFEPDRTAMINRVASGRAAARARAERFRRILPMAAAAAVAIILSLSVIAVRSGDHDGEPVAHPPVLTATSPSAPLPSPSTSSRSSATSRSPSADPATGSTVVTAGGAIDGHSVATWSQHNVTVASTKKIVSLTVTIRIAATPGASEAGRFTTAPNSDVTVTVTHGSRSLIYSYVLKKGRTLIPGSYVFAAQFNHRSGRAAGGDSYAVDARAAGGHAVLAGTFG
jgi:hypothetical protein